MVELKGGRHGWTKKEKYYCGRLIKEKVVEGL